MVAQEVEKESEPIPPQLGKIVSVDVGSLKPTKIWDLVVGKYGFYVRLKKIALVKIRCTINYEDSEKRAVISVKGEYDKNSFVVPLKTYNREPIVLQSLEELREFAENTELPFWVHGFSERCPLIKINKIIHVEVYNHAKNYLSKKYSDHRFYNIISLDGTDYKHVAICKIETIETPEPSIVTFNLVTRYDNAKTVYKPTDENVIPMWLRGLWHYYYRHKVDSDGFFFVGDEPSHLTFYLTDMIKLE